MSTLHSFWKENLIYFVKTKGYKIKIYEMKDEFHQEFEFSAIEKPHLLYVKVTKERLTVDFVWIISEKNLRDENFLKVISYGKNKWREENGRTY
jgi:hypothetical protein